MKSIDIDFEEMVVDQDGRLNFTPTIFELEEIMKLLPKRHWMDVKLTRMQLKWLIKTARTDLGMLMKHPYKGPGNSRPPK